MKSAIDTDLKQLKIIFSMFEKYDKAIHTQNIHEELSERLHEELDYKLEAKYCKLYSHLLKDEQNIHVPQIVGSLSTDRLLTATWLDGNGIMDYIDEPVEIRNQIAMNMFRA